MIAEHVKRATAQNLTAVAIYDGSVIYKQLTPGYRPGRYSAARYAG